MKNLLIGFSFALLLVVVGVSSYYLYKKTDVNRQISKFDSLIQNTLLLEDEIFDNCMQGKEKSSQNVLVCEQNTEQQLTLLTRDAVAAKQRLENLSASEIFQY